MQGRAGQSISRSVAVTAKLDKPLVLEPIQFNLDGKVAYAVKEIERGRRFQITFRNILEQPGLYRGFLKVKTNYPEKPVVTIQIRGRFIEAKKMAP